MKIRTLVKEDAWQVEQLIKNTNIKIKDANHTNSGFLLYNYGLDNYTERLSKYNIFSFGCFEDNKLVGCVLSYPVAYLKNHGELIDHESKVFDELLKMKTNNLIWGEQIAILPSKRRKLYGKLLMKQTYKTMQDNGFTEFSCMVSLFPNLNKAGIQFLISEKIFSMYKTVKENNTIWAIFYGKLLK